MVGAVDGRGTWSPAHYPRDAAPRHSKAEDTSPDDGRGHTTTATGNMPSAGVFLNSALATQEPTHSTACDSRPAHELAAEFLEIAKPMLDNRPHDHGIEPSVLVHGHVAKADHPPHPVRDQRREQ